MRIRFTTPFAVSAALRASRRWRRAPVCRARRFGYSNDAAGRRTAISRSGEAFGDLSGAVDAYGYNLRSEVVSARRTKGGASVCGFDEDFSYDPIGNRIATTNYTETGSAIVSEYIANSLNQYTSRTVPGVAAVRGFADADATVTVNENPTWRLGEYFFGSDEFDNSQSSVDAALVTTAALASSTNGPDEVASVTSHVHIAKTPQLFEYDLDGNQTLVATKTGTWRVTYNGENRPVLWERVAADSNTLTSNTQTRVSMSFDHQGRRRMYLEVSADGSTNRLDHFTYDNYLCIVRNRWQPDGTSAADRFTWDPTELVATRPLVWNFSTFQPFNVSTCYYAHDGNKNVSELVSSADGTISAHYEYAPFGEVILSSGDLALTNPFRFSSECFDDMLGLVYYNYRDFNPLLGRWFVRDPYYDCPVYGVVRNCSINAFDYLGLATVKVGERIVNPEAPNEYKQSFEPVGLKEGCELNFIQLAFKYAGNRRREWLPDTKWNGQVQVPPLGPYYVDWSHDGAAGYEQGDSRIFYDRPDVDTWFYLFVVESCCLKKYKESDKCNCCMKSRATILHRIIWYREEGEIKVLQVNDSRKEKMDKKLKELVDGKSFPVDCVQYQNDNKGSWKTLQMEMEIDYGN